jgi:hypothetical protein
MRKILKNIAASFLSIKNNFFLKKHIPLASTMTMLKDLYPSVDWTRVDFYEGLPWFTPFIAPYVTAQALPQFYSLSRYRIYLKKFDESRAQCLADIVHEGYHVMQAMQFWKGYGIGFFRGLMLYYNALFLKYGYHANPFEITAHDQEYRFLDYCTKHGLRGVIPKVNPDAFANIAEEKPLVFNKYEFRYDENIVALAGSFFFCGLVTIVKPFVDVLIYGMSFFMLRWKTQGA